MSVGPDEGEHWFEPIADHLGRAYLRYSHTKGTVQEVDHLVRALQLEPGSGCSTWAAGPAATPTSWPGGASCATASTSARASSSWPTRTPRRARPSPAWTHGTLRDDAEFDAAIALCQGGFGMSRYDRDDEAILAAAGGALRPGGRLALTVFNVYFAVRYHTDAEFDADRGVAHERTEVRDETGAIAAAELWTGCYTPRELRPLLARGAGLVVERISSSSRAPTATTRRPPSAPSSCSSPAAPPDRRDPPAARPVQPARPCAAAC